jgi:Reverse transcriptase (RNA-dependent DNA polymerase)
MDYMIIIGNDREKIKLLEMKLFEKFEMKNMCGLKYFLGFEVALSNKNIFLSQRNYIPDLLAEIEMLECKSVETLMVKNHKLWLDHKQSLIDKERYQRLIKKIIYLSRTRHDITYAVIVVS